MTASLFSFGAKIEGVTKGLTTAMSAITALSTIGTSLSTESLLGEVAHLIPNPVAPLSANNIIRAVRSMGFPVQRQAALKVIRQVKAITANRDYVNKLGPNTLPTAKNLAYSPYRITSKYQYIVSVTGTNPITGELSQQWITVSADKRLTKIEAEYLATAALLTGENYGISEVEDAHVDNILRSPTLV